MLLAHHDETNYTPPVHLSGLRASIVHDWLPVYAGAERVLEQMLHVLPEAKVCTLIDFLEGTDRDFLEGRAVETSFIQRMPRARTHYRYYLPFAPIAVEQFDLSDSEIVLSSSYVVAKGVLTSAEQLHVSYVHSPMRAAWDLYFEHLREARMDRGLRSLLARALMHYIRFYDAVTAKRVDAFLANSHTVARRIWKTYRRRARVVYPPVDTARFALTREKADYYVTASRLVPYKRIDLLVEAFREMPHRKLIVLGDGPERARLEERAPANVEVRGHVPIATLRHLVAHARAFLFAAQEDFGIAPVEAQACGTPVIAYGRGGATETVVDEVTGLFFRDQNTDALQDAIRRFEAREWQPERIREHAEQFSVERFRTELTAELERAWYHFERFERDEEPEVLV